MLSIILAIENEQDRSVMEWLYEKYEKKMYIEVYDVLKHHQDTQDCVQDTVEKMIDALPTFKAAEEVGNLAGLVVVTCRNCAKNYYKWRARRRRREYISDESCDGTSFDIEQFPDEYENIQESLISEENCRYIQSLIDSLDAIYRDVILLKSQGLGYDKIAILLGVSEDVVRQRMSRGRKMLLEKGGSRLYENKPL